MEVMKIHGVPHFVFKDRAEWEDYHINTGKKIPPLVENWKEGEEGDWVLADDGGVVQILRRGETKKRGVLSKAWLRTIVGTFWVNKYDKMDTDITIRKYPQGRYRFSGDNLSPAQRVKRRVKCTQAERLFGLYLMSGFVPEDAYEKSHKYNGDPQRLKEKSWFLFKQERIMSHVRDEIKKAAQEAGLSQTDVFRYTKRFIEDKTINDNLRYKALSDLAIYLDVKTEEKTSTLGVGGFIGSMQHKSFERRLGQIDEETHNKITAPEDDVEDVESEDV